MDLLNAVARGTARPLGFIPNEVTLMKPGNVSSDDASDGIQELAVDLSGSPYYSLDMAPIPRAARRWSAARVPAAR